MSSPPVAWPDSGCGVGGGGCRSTSLDDDTDWMFGGDELRQPKAFLIEPAETYPKVTFIHELRLTIPD